MNHTISRTSRTFNPNTQMENEDCNGTASVLEPTPTVNHQSNLKLTICETNGFTPGPTENSESQEAIRPREVVVNPINVACIYRQDVVRCNKNWSQIGVVTEVAGDSDSESGITDDDDDDDDDEDDDDEYDDDDGFEDDGGDYDELDGDSNGCGDGNGRGVSKSEPLPADQVRVFWMDHSETTQNLNDVTVVDRGFLHGDIVAAASDPTGQVGVVVDVNLSVDLLAADGSIIVDVSSRALRRVREFSVGDYVVLGPWLGRVDDVLDTVTVLFDDGAISKVTKADPLQLKPVSKHILEDGNFPYYPGQRVRASSSSVFKNARWLSGLWRASRLEGTVTKVTAGSVFIYWIASAGSGSWSATTPAEEQNPKNLKLLSCFAHANWQLGDWCLLPLHFQSPSAPNNKGSMEAKHEDLIIDGLVSADLGSGNGSEEGFEEKLGGYCSSSQDTEAMDLDVSPLLDEKCGNVEMNVSQECSSCGGVLSVSKEPVHESWPIHRKKIRRVVVRRDKKARRKEENFERALVIVNTKTRVDVAWQDGKTEFGLDSTTLIPIDTPGDHDFVVEQYVVEKVSDDSYETSEVRRVGVVKSVNAKEKTAIVRWLKPVARPEDPREFDKEEVVSVYELEAHPDYDYCYGDFVVRLSPVSASDQTVGLRNSVEELKQHSPNEVKQDLKCHPGCEEVDETSNDETYAEFSDLSWVGNITGLKDGDIEVTWADEMVSTVGPQAIYVVGRDEDEESIGAGSEASDDAASWETVNEEEMDVLESAEEDAELQSAVDNNPEAEDCKTVHSEENNSGRNGPLSISLAALGFVTRLASGFFSRGRKQTHPLCSQFGDEAAAESQNERKVTNAASSSQEYNAVGGFGPQTTEYAECALVAADVLDAAESLCSLRSEEPDASSITASHEDEACSFKRFDTAKDPSDHYFNGANGQNNNERKWLKKVQQDWGVLQKNLPDGIYVRVYEDRMDLLRAAIIGAYGTPYQDGVFIFDFHLPPEYPQVPPSVHYHSGGWRINPNLYEDGKVCLSLLNTWAGRGNEVWDPSSSSILQVLVSLQGLVLNSKPYFNEAGYDKQVGTVEGEKNSLSYNENTFLLNCKSIMHLLRRPPKDFEELIKDHFQMRGSYILRACDAYKRGYLIGSLSEDACISDKSEANSTSVGFKLVLAKILPELLLALKKVGADCHEFKHLQQP